MPKLSVCIIGRRSVRLKHLSVPSSHNILKVKNKRNLILTNE